MEQVLLLQNSDYGHELDTLSRLLAWPLSEEKVVNFDNIVQRFLIEDLMLGRCPIHC